MSALEQTPLPISPSLVDERRSTPRIHIANSVAVLLGRGSGFLIDLSLNGARLRHTVQVLRGSNLRISFVWDGERFASTAEVLASRVVALSNGTLPTLYESRLRFRLVTATAAQLLQRVLDSLESEDIRKWVANMKGWNDSTLPNVHTANVRHGSYLRCRLVNDRWETKWTHDPKQPENGFVLPESVDRREIADLCETYQRLDADGRHLVRLLAAATLV